MGSPQDTQDNWQAHEAALQAGQLSPCDAFGTTYDLLTRLLHEDKALGQAVLAALPKRCNPWPQVGGVHLALHVVRADLSIWQGDSRSRVDVWRQGEVMAQALGSPPLTTLYLALMIGHLFNAGLIVEGLEAYERAAAGMQTGADDGVEIRMRIHATCASALLGRHEQAIKLGLLTEQALVQRGWLDWFGRAANLGLIAGSMLWLENDRMNDTGACCAETCQQALGLLDKAKALVRTSPDKRHCFTRVSLLLGSSRLHFLINNTERARSDLHEIDAAIKALPALTHYKPRLATGRALIHLADGEPEAALAVLDEAREKLLSARVDAPALDWWKVRSDVLGALGRWKEAHEAQSQHIATRRTAARQQAELLATIAERRLDHFNASALQFLFHDLNAPLNSIVAMARSAAADGGTPEAMQRLAALAERASHIAGHSIDCLRVLMVDQADFKRIDLRTVLDDACEDTEALGADKGVRLQRQLAGPAWVVGDQDLLRRAFANVLSNAIRFSPNQAVVTVSLVSLSPGLWTASIADLGPGFDPQSVALVQATPAGAAASKPTPAAPSQGQGHGLGLSFVTRALSKHDASLRVSPNAPRGARVHMHFHEAEQALAASLQVPAFALAAAAQTEASRVVVHAVGTSSR
jgi:signal transduction histidine kinase